jgi:hypothetical protein
MSGYAWRHDPRHVLFTLARYKFVAKMLAGKGPTLEIGCADGFGTRLVAQETASVLGIDVDAAMIASAHLSNDAGRIGFLHYDLLEAPLLLHFASAYAIDVLEHIPPSLEDRFMRHAALSLGRPGTLLLGTPSLESQAYASAPSREGHVNCQTQSALRALCERYFETVFLLGMNDEVVHTGFGPMCHYLWALCVGVRS